MKLKIIISLSVLYFFTIEKINCQKFFKNIEFSFGYGVQPQDRRLFEFPIRKNLLHWKNPDMIFNMIFG
jgi:hypothetical protein